MKPMCEFSDLFETHKNKKLGIFRNSKISQIWMTGKNAKITRLNVMVCLLKIPEQYRLYHVYTLCIIRRTVYMAALDIILSDIR